MIQIHDSKKKGEFFVRTTGKNNEPLATSETLKSKQAVGKHLIAMCNQWVVSEKDDEVKTMSTKTKVDDDFASEIDDFHASVMGQLSCPGEKARLIDHTKSQHWTKKYGCKSGLK